MAAAECKLLHFYDDCFMLLQTIYNFSQMNNRTGNITYVEISQLMKLWF